ncbi:MAG: hypothetical protein LBV73_19555 [Paraburkholderia sp.]|jgi:hypothetical protein|nr:hypothetical protein [Paraburkholderia sp.]
MIWPSSALSARGAAAHPEAFALRCMEATLVSQIFDRQLHIPFNGINMSSIPFNGISKRLPEKLFRQIILGKSLIFPTK